MSYIRAWDNMRDALYSGIRYKRMTYPTFLWEVYLTKAGNPTTIWKRLHEKYNGKTLFQIIYDAAVKAGIPPAMLFAVAHHESAFKRDATLTNTNGTTDRGLFQVNDASYPNFDISQYTNPYYTADFSAQKILAKGYRVFESLPLPARIGKTLEYYAAPGAATRGSIDWSAKMGNDFYKLYTMWDRFLTEPVLIPIIGITVAGLIGMAVFF